MLDWLNFRLGENNWFNTCARKEILSKISHSCVITLAQYISESLHIDDIDFMENHSYVLMLTSSKTDIFRHGVRIPVYSNHQYFVLFKIMTEYIKLRRCAGAVDSDPLFVSAKASFCVDVFISNIRDIRSSLGYDSSKFHGHSIVQETIFPIICPRLWADGHRIAIQIHSHWRG